MLHLRGTLVAMRQMPACAGYAGCLCRHPCALLTARASAAKTGTRYPQTVAVPPVRQHCSFSGLLCALRFTLRASAAICTEIAVQDARGTAYLFCAACDEALLQNFCTIPSTDGVRMGGVGWRQRVEGADRTLLR